MEKHTALAQWQCMQIDNQVANICFCQTQGAPGMLILVHAHLNTACAGLLILGVFLG